MQDAGRAGGDVVTFRELLPPRLLQPHVWSLWIHHVPGTDAPYVHREIPAGGAHVVCDSTGRVELIGPQTRFTQRTIEPGTTVVGARLRPGVRLERLVVPAAELIDSSVLVEGLTRHSPFGPSPDGDVPAADALTWLTRQLAEAFADDGTDMTSAEVSRLVDTAGQRFVPAGPTGLSDRQHRRRFHTRVGVSPRTLHRLLRFQLVLREIQRGPGADIDLAGLAHAAGYADQPHLSRECLRLSGVSPRQLVADTSQHCGPHHDHRPAFAPLGAAAPIA